MAPQPFQTRRIGGGIVGRMLYALVPEIVLNQTRVCSLTGQDEVASMANHTRMIGLGQPCSLAIFADRGPVRIYGLGACPLA